LLFVLGIFPFIIQAKILLIRTLFFSIGMNGTLFESASALSILNDISKPLWVMDKAIIAQKDEDIKPDDNDDERERGSFHPLIY
jgi:hypothetical protein